MTETLMPANRSEWLEMRKNDVTSTEVAALFDCSPYLTKYELWHRKHDNLDIDFQVNDRMKWGTRLEESIAKGIAEDNNWIVSRMPEYLRHSALRIGASFDYRIDGFGTDYGILEVKNVDSLAFREGWIVDGDNVEAPPHIELQVQQQLYLSGYKTAYIGALIGGNRVVLIKREPDQKVIGAIINRVTKFWNSVARNEPPKPDFQRDADFIRELFSDVAPGKVFSGNDGISKLVLAYKDAAKVESEAKKNKEAARAEILTLIGDSEKVTGENYTISAGFIGPQRIEYDRAGYRDFRIYMKKEKKLAHDLVL